MRPRVQSPWAKEEAEIPRVVTAPEDEAAHVNELKDFLSEVCCQSYPDVDKFEAERSRIEEQRPRYSEQDDDLQRSADASIDRSPTSVPQGLGDETMSFEKKSGRIEKKLSESKKSTCARASVPQGLVRPKSKQLKWGKIRLGRIPQFVREDAGPHYALAPSEHGAKRRALEEYLKSDAATYKRNFNVAFQYFAARSQHHIHPLRRVKRPIGKQEQAQKKMKTEDSELIRVIPNACRSKGNKNECKHEAPWTELLNCGAGSRPLLICPGLAKKKGLRCSGARNTIGQMLLLRNNEWFNGTIPGFCIAFAGSNSDVKPNDRLPITNTTHESAFCRSKCVKRKSSKNMLQRVQHVQATINGYFGGYMCKRQKAGQFETKKCIDKIYMFFETAVQGRVKARSSEQAVVE